MPTVQVRILPTMSSPYKNTLPTSSGVPVGLVVVLQASVFLYGITVRVQWSHALA
jgi:hypothetical protein